MGSHSTSAPALVPTRTAPSAHASRMASSTGVSFSTDRRCMAEVPAR